MKIKRKELYAFTDSLKRIDQMLDSYVNQESCESEIKTAKTDLPQKTGVYVSGTVLVVTFFVQGDVKLINKIKVYRAFSSEVISILSANPDCEDIHTYGNTILAVFNTPFKKKMM